MYKLKQQGFTLIEMAVVLVITGLLLSAVMSLGNTQIAQSRISTTKSKEDSIKTALITYLSRNKRMPCPAVNVAQGAAGYGTEATATVGTCDGLTVNSGVYSGVLPWISLGLTSDNAQDGYYNRFAYTVTASSIALNANTVSGLRGAITTHTAGPGTAANQSNNCSGGAAVNPCAFVAIIISNGANAFGAYTTSGTQIAFNGGPDELENTNNDNAFVLRDFTTDTVNPYDDILLPLSVSDLLTPLTVNGSLKDYNAVLSHNFDTISGAALTAAVTTRSGVNPGSRSYTLPLNTGIALTDPWGGALTYTRTAAGSVALSTTVPGIPTDVAYTITSLGPDGTASADDIIRNVTIGEVEAVYSTYGW